MVTGKETRQDKIKNIDKYKDVGDWQNEIYMS